MRGGSRLPAPHSLSPLTDPANQRDLLANPPLYSEPIYKVYKYNMSYKYYIVASCTNTTLTAALP